MPPPVDEALEKLRRRLRDQTPLIGDWRRRGAARALADLGSAAAVHILAEAATESEDAVVRESALEALGQLTGQEGIDTLCEVWAGGRHPKLATLLAEKGWIASAPLQIRVLTALHSDPSQLSIEEEPRLAKLLLSTTLEDPDPLIVKKARLTLRQMAQRGKKPEVHALTELLMESEEESQREVVRKVLGEVRNSGGIREICQLWVRTRHPELADLIVEHRWVPRTPGSPRVEVLTALKVGELERVARGSERSLPSLILACSDRDPVIAERARQVLPRLGRAALRQRLFELLTQPDHSRAPGAARALAVEGSAPATRLLARAYIESENRKVRKIAREVLKALDEWRAITAACGIWAESRHPRLAALLALNKWVASRPPELKVLTALKVGRLDEVTGGDADVVAPLVAAREDLEPVIAERARWALPRLEKEEAQEAVCRLFIERGDPRVRDAALEGGYAPRDEQQRALFFFLAEQWERYEGLDFDQQLLRTAYTVAGDPLRRRIREKLRAAGRSDFLSVIAGQDYRARATEMAQSELDILTQTLIANREWPRLWELLFEVSLTRGVRIVEALTGAGWEPEDGESRALLGALVDLATHEEGLPTSEPELQDLFPPALLEAQAQVSGRVNDVAFSPTRPVVAIGTGERKVVVWNYQRAEREQLWGPVDHSVGSVTFTGDGSLVWGERTNRTNVRCNLYRWKEGSVEPPVVLGHHSGSVTALAPVGDDRVLSSGRDCRAILWNVTTRNETVRLSGAYSWLWARAVALSPGEKWLAWLHRGVQLVEIAKPTRRLYSAGSSVARSGAFLPRGHTQTSWKGHEQPAMDLALLVGQYGGDVMLYYPRRYSRSLRLHRERTPFTQHAGRVEGVRILHNANVAVTAGSEGLVRFIDLHDRTLLGEVAAPRPELTSLHVSPDEAFMVVGNSQAQISFWDLRTLHALRLLRTRLGEAPTSALTTLKGLREAQSLSPRACRTLEFAERVLQHRVRFDIEIEPVISIMAGEFDIELE